MPDLPHYADTSIRVTIYWPDGGYAIPAPASTMKEARQIADRWMKDQEKPNPNYRIQIIRTMTEIIECEPWKLEKHDG